MSGIVASIVAICLLAVSGARPADTLRRDDGHSQVRSAHEVLAGALLSRRDGQRSELRSDLRLAPFTLPAPAAAPAVPRSTVVAGEPPQSVVLDGQAPVPCSRGPPRG